MTTTARRALKSLLCEAQEYAFRGSIESGTEMGAQEREEIERRYLDAINGVENLLGLKPTKSLEDDPS